MGSRRYKEPEPIDRAAALGRIEAGGPDACDALVGLAFHDEDGAFVESLCLRLIGTSRDDDLRGLAVTCIGHVARIHGQLFHPETMGVLRSLLTDGRMGDRAGNALDDVAMFARGCSG